MKCYLKNIIDNMENNDYTYWNDEWNKKSNINWEQMNPKYIIKYKPYKLEEWKN